jgi:hypothetical protein
MSPQMPFEREVWILYKNSARAYGVRMVQNFHTRVKPRHAVRRAVHLSQDQKDIYVHSQSRGQKYIFRIASSQSEVSNLFLEFDTLP